MLTFISCERDSLLLLMSTLTDWLMMAMTIMMMMTTAIVVVVVLVTSGILISLPNFGIKVIDHKLKLKRHT